MLEIDVVEDTYRVHLMVKYATDNLNHIRELKSCIVVNTYIWLSYVMFCNVKSYVMCCHQCQRGILLASIDNVIDDAMNLCKESYKLLFCHSCQSLSWLDIMLTQ